MTEQDREKLLKGIAEFIPDFQFHRPPDGRLTHLVGPDGMAIFINESRQRGKIHVFGDWPKDGNSYMTPRSWGAVPYGETGDIGINVSEARGMQAIANDIVRRFLPEYRKLYAICMEKKRDQDLYNDKRYANAVQVAEAAGLAKPARAGSNQDYRMSLNGSSYKWYGSVTVTGSGAAFDVRAVSIAKATRILAILHEKES